MWVYPPGKGQDGPQEYPGTWLQELIHRNREGEPGQGWERELGHRKKNAVWEHKPGCHDVLRDSMFERLAAPRSPERTGSRWCQVPVVLVGSRLRNPRKLLSLAISKNQNVRGSITFSHDLLLLLFFFFFFFFLLDVDYFLNFEALGRTCIHNPPAMQLCKKPKINIRINWLH